MISHLMKRYLYAQKRFPRIFGGISWLFKKPILFLLDGITLVRGFALPKDPYLPPYKIQMLLGIYEPETVRLCKRLIQPGMTVIDGGAHVGYFTRIFSTLVGPSGKVVAYEPHPKNVEVLRKNLGGKRYGNVTIRNAAIGSGNDTLTLYEAEGSVGHSLHDADIRQPGAKVEVANLDDDLGHLGITTVDFVKLDVEGNEIEAFKGMQEILKNSPTVSLILEYRKDNSNITAEELYHVLTIGGFKIKILSRDEVIPVESQFAFSGITKCNLLALSSQ